MPNLAETGAMTWKCKKNKQAGILLYMQIGMRDIRGYPPRLLKNPTPWNYLIGTTN
jgi:hypothetical protein